MVIPGISANNATTATGGEEADGYVLCQLKYVSSMSCSSTGGNEQYPTETMTVSFRSGRLHYYG